jgi:UDP-N-acetylmuramyl tripeptide synthase
MTTERRTAARSGRDGGVLSRLQLELALSAGKLTGATGRLMGVGGGTSLPGIVARRIDPNVLRKVVGASAARKIVVSGSNGKTTTCRMIAALARSNGSRVFQNRAGSNLIQGVTSVAINGADLLGHVDADTLILEIDEATLRYVLPEIQPDVVVYTNILRDQLDRFGEVYSVARAMESAIHALPATSTVVLNGDDPLIAEFAPDAACKRLYFGLSAPEVGQSRPEHGADSIRCMRCQHDLAYERVYLSHLGIFSCPHCGTARPALDIEVTRVALRDLEPTQMTIRLPSGPRDVSLSLPGLHNVYNAAAAAATAVALGIDSQHALGALSGMRPAFGRLEEIQAGGRRIVLAMVKNPISYNTVLRTVLQGPGNLHVLAAHSNSPVDGEDFAWLWDVDLESLAPRVTTLVASGTKADEIALRYKYAGLDPAAMVAIPDLREALDAALARVPPSEPLYILSGYTQTRELRQVMQRRGWVQHFWED